MSLLLNTLPRDSNKAMALVFSVALYDDSKYRFSIGPPELLELGKRKRYRSCLWMSMRH